jgi:hypothetical protein
MEIHIHRQERCDLAGNAGQISIFCLAALTKTYGSRKAVPISTSKKGK